MLIWRGRLGMPELCSLVWMLSLKKSSLSSPIMTSLKGKTSPYKITSVAWPGVCHEQTSPARAKNEGPRFWTIRTFETWGHCARSSVEVSHRRSARLLTASINITFYSRKNYTTVSVIRRLYPRKFLRIRFLNFRDLSRRFYRYLQDSCGHREALSLFQAIFSHQAGRLSEFMK